MSAKRRRVKSKRSGGMGWRKRDFLPYAEGRTFTRLLGLKSKKEWQEWSKSGQRPSNIPSGPWDVYRGKGWVSMMDWLGYSFKPGDQNKGNYLPFVSARAWVQQRKLKNAKEWREWRKSGQRPSNIPSAPDEVYRGKGWVSMPDWLGKNVNDNGKFKPVKYLPFSEARARVHQRKMKSTKEWREWSKSGQRPSNIPSNPHKAYRGKGWVSMPDWLGCEKKGRAKKDDFLPILEARAWVQQRNLKSHKEWKEWRKSGQRPSNIPSHPDEVYRGKGWVSWQDWMGYLFKNGDQHRKRKRLEPAEAPQQQPLATSSSSSSSSCSSSSSSAPALENCAICFEPLCPVTTKIGHLACVHTFHIHCLAPLAHASARPSTSSRRGVLLNCPLCRKRCRYLPEDNDDDDDDDE
eukprot:g2374.t1